MPPLTRYLGPLVAAFLMVLFVVLLEGRVALPWNRWWHRLWYLRSLARDSELRQWEERYARLNISQRSGKVPKAEVIFEGVREDAVDVLLHLVTKKQPTSLNRILVLGKPGSGKTTVLQRFTFELAARGVKRFSFRQPIPVFVRLGGFQSGHFLKSGAV